MHLSRVSSLSCDGSNHLWRRFESLYSQMLKRFKCICNPSSTSVSSLWKYPLTVWCAYYIHYLCQKFPLVIYLIADNASIPQLVVADSLFWHSMKQQAPYFHRICRLCWLWLGVAGHFHLDWAAGLKVCLESTLRKCLRLYSYRHVSFLITSSKSPLHASVRNVIITFEGSLRGITVVYRYQKFWRPDSK